MSEQCSKCNVLIIDSEVELMKRFIEESYYGMKLKTQIENDGFICSNCLWNWENGDKEKNMTCNYPPGYTGNTKYQQFLCWVQSFVNKKACR